MIAQYIDQIYKIWVYSIDFSAFAIVILFTVKDQSIFYEIRSLAA